MRAAIDHQIGALVLALERIASASSQTNPLGSRHNSRTFQGDKALPLPLSIYLYSPSLCLANKNHFKIGALFPVCSSQENGVMTPPKKKFFLEKEKNCELIPG